MLNSVTETEMPTPTAGLVGFAISQWPQNLEERSLHDLSDKKLSSYFKCTTQARFMSHCKVSIPAAMLQQLLPIWTNIERNYDQFTM